MYKQVYKKVRVASDNFFNQNTGETMSSEIPNVTSMNVVDANHIMIDSKEFFIVDKVALDYLEIILPEKDMNYVYKLTNMCAGKMNFLVDKVDNPITKVELQKTFKLAESRFKSLFKSLMDNSVIACTEVIKERKKYKYISLNPTLARRAKILDVYLKKIFPDLTLLVKDGSKSLPESSEF